MLGLCSKNQRDKEEADLKRIGKNTVADMLGIDLAQMSDDDGEFQQNLDDTVGSDSEVEEFDKEDRERACARKASKNADDEEEQKMVVKVKYWMKKMKRQRY